MLGSSNDLNVKIDATVTGFEAGMIKAQAATARYDSQLKSLESDMMKLEKSLDDEVTAALQRQHDAMDKTGKAAMLMGGAVLAGLGLAVNEAIKWEYAWKGVTKTTNGSAQQLNVLEGQLRQLALELPATHEEIAAVAEAAGQLGVKRDDIAAFTKVMINLGQATNLSADEAATAIAQFMNVMGTASDKVDEIGNTLVGLGNKGASTESEIMSMAQRLVGAGKLIGASEQDVLGLAAAMANLGIQSQLGGGAAQRVLLILYSAVKEGGKSLASFAKVSGLSASEFAQQWSTSPIQAFNAFLQGLGKIKASGGNVVGTLNDLGIKGTQNLQVMLRLAGAGDQLTQALNVSNSAWEKNVALTNEVNKRYETTAAKIEIARNQIADAAITVGGTLLPAIAKVVGVVSDFTAAWEQVPGPLKSVLTIALGVGGAVTFLGGAALVAVPKIAAFNTAVAELDAGALKSAGMKLQGLSSVLAGPWGIAIAAGISALGLFAAKQGAAAREVESLKETLDQQTGALTDNSREWAVKKLADAGLLQTAKDLGLNLQQVTDAALLQGSAMKTVNDQLNEVIRNGTKATPGGPVLSQTAFDAAHLQKVLLDTNGTLADSREQWRLEHEAMGGAAKGADQAATATGKAGDAQAGTTAAWQDGATAAGDLSQQVETLADDFDSLAGNYLNAREAGRQVRDSLRGIRSALKQYAKQHGDLDGAFKKGTKSGDEFAGMLDGLAKDYQNQVDSVEKLTGSQKRTLDVYRESRKRLVDVAEQLGYTKKAAEDYAAQVLGTPTTIRTYFTANGIDQATTQADHYKGILDGLNGKIVRTFIEQHVTKAENMGRSGPPQANGGILQTFAGGGFAASGDFVERVPQIAYGRDIRWAEPETGWEAYISGKPGQESRNREVWLEAGRRLGLVGNRLQQMQIGGRSFGAGSSGAGVERLAQQLAVAAGSARAGGLPSRVQLVLDDGMPLWLRVRAEAGEVFAARDNYKQTTGPRRHAR